MIKLPQVRLSVDIVGFGRVWGGTFTLPATLTGAMDRTVFCDGRGVRVSHVEVEISMPERDWRIATWVPITALVTEHGEPMQYWDARRAILLTWARNRVRNLKVA